MEINATEEPTVNADFVEMFYSTDKNGHARAYRFSRQQFRSFPMSRKDADAAILEGRAVILDGNPMKPAPATEDTNDGLAEFNASLVKCYADAEAEFTANQKPAAKWSRIGSGMFMAIVNGTDLYVAGSQGSWAIMVAKAGERITARYDTKREAMLAAEREAS